MTYQPRFRLIPLSEDDIGPSRSLRIIREVAEDYGVTVHDLRSDKRARQYSWPRQIAMLRLVDETPLSYPAIARVLGGKDHTTIIYGERAARQRIKEGLQP